MTKIPAHILPLARAAAAKVWRDADGHNEARRIEEGENDGFAVKVAATAIQAEQERMSDARKTRKSIDTLDGIAFGLALNAGQGPTTVTIEMERRQAEQFLFNVAKELEIFFKDFHRPAPRLILGAAFQYRGVSFRVVERAI